MNDQQTSRTDTLVRDFGACPKCGWEEMRVTYHSGRFDFSRDHYDPCRYFHQEQREHFSVNCARCHFTEAVPV